MTLFRKKAFAPSALWVIRLIGVIVPRRLRSEWRQEWEAELRHRQALLAEWERLNWRTKLDLLRRSTGALWDALWLQPQRWEDEMIQDLRFGVRMLMKNPGFTLVVVLTLALGVGANTALFSVVDAVLLRPLPFAEPERLVRIHMAVWLFKLHPKSPSEFMSPEEPVDAFAQVAAYDAGRINLTDESTPGRIHVMRVTSGFFPVLGVGPLMGRVFAAGEQELGQNRIVILSYGLWQTRFGADPNVLNKTVRLNNNSFTIIGVMPRNFRFHHWKGDADAWIPLTPSDGLIGAETTYYEMIGRLRPGLSLPQAQTQMDTIYQRVLQRHPKLERQANAIRLIPLREKFTGNLRSPLLILLAAVGCVLLIACANAANLLLARSATRQKEVAIRAALGASRRRLIRQWLTESLLLSLLGGVLGLLFAAWSVKALIAISPAQISLIHDITIDRRVLIFTLLVSILTGVLFGLAPALQFSKPDLNESLKEGGRRGAAGFSPRLRNLLMVSEIALALVLLIGAGLLVKSFRNLLDIKIGFDPQNVLTLELSPTPLKYPSAEQRAAFYQQIIERVRALPGVEHAGTINHLPVALTGGSIIGGFDVEGRSYSPETRPQAAYRVASADYFDAMRIPLLAGRRFTEQDDAPAQRVVIINESLAREVFPDENPIGKRIIISFGKPTTYEIVGVVGDTKHRGLETEIDPGYYLHIFQQPSPFASLVVRTVGDPTKLPAAVRDAIWEVDRDHPIYNVKTMERHVAESLSRRRFSMFLLSIFAALALLLSAVGIYGVIAYSVTQRTHEIGIRMALGAREGDVLKLIVSQGMLLVMIGAGVGLIAAYAVTRVLTSMLYGVSPTDPVTFAGVVLLLSAVALLACWFPARRAAKTDPGVALRYE